MLGEFIWTAIVFTAGTWAGKKWGGPKEVWAKVWGKINGA